MEFERPKRPDRIKKLPSLRWNGDLLSYEAGMLCMLLAACSCDRVPALLFIRPFNEQRRWEPSGEVAKLRSLSDRDVPQWPRKLFGWITRATSILVTQYPHFDPAVFEVLGEDLLKMSFEGEDLFLGIADTRKEEIWTGLSTEDHVLLWLDLVQLTIYAYPDPYAESYWRRVSWCLGEVISSTVLPFLSVLEWGHLQGFPPRYIHDLLLFLVYYFIIDHANFDTFVHLRPSIVRRLDFDYSGILWLLKLKATLARHILIEQGSNDTSIVPETEAGRLTPRARGIINLMVDSAGIPDELLKSGSVVSTLEICAATLLSTKVNKGMNESLESSKTELPVRFALAIELVNRKRFLDAYGCLRIVVETFGPTTLLYQRDYLYFPVVIELVKCCNILGKEDEGEVLALEALTHATEAAIGTQACSMQITLADSLIGQKKYQDAETLLEAVLDSSSASAYLRLLATLRLNKAKRRLGSLTRTDCFPEGHLSAALWSPEEMSVDVRNECLDELASTRCCIEQKKTNVQADSRTISETQRYEELKRLVREREGREHAERQRRESAEREAREANVMAELVASLLANPDAADDWRGRALRDQMFSFCASTGSMDQRRTVLRADLDHGRQSTDPNARLRVMVVSQFFHQNFRVYHEKLERFIDSLSLGHEFDVVRSVLPRSIADTEYFVRNSNLVIIIEDNGILESVHGRIKNLPLEFDYFLAPAEDDLLRYYYVNQSFGLPAVTILHLKKTLHPPEHVRFPELSLYDTEHVNGVPFDKRTLLYKGPPKVTESSPYQTLSNWIVFSEEPTRLSIFLRQQLQFAKSTPQRSPGVLERSRIILGRCITNLDHPWIGHVTELCLHYIEGIQGLHYALFYRQRLYSDTRKYSTVRFSAKSIYTYWSACGDEDPVFSNKQQYQELASWVKDRGTAFLIVGYQTFVDVNVSTESTTKLSVGIRRMSWQEKGNTNESEPLQLIGEKIGAICVRPVNVVAGDEGRTLHFGEKQWVIYFALVREPPNGGEPAPKRISKR